MATFKYHKLQLIKPDFDSNLTNLIIDLEKLKSKSLQGSTPVHLFLQLKDIYHTFESIYSARIEGNHTTITNYISHNKNDKLQNSQSVQFQEIENIEKCLEYIETLEFITINHEFIQKIHSLITSNLESNNYLNSKPGLYRTNDVMIGQSEHLPPFPEMINELINELIEFTNKPNESKFDLIKLATFHHRFTWIHPFQDGNGRTIRALTYALLIKYGFLKHRIINPTAIFCKNRDDYYKNLSIADNGSLLGLSNWVEYLLHGLKIEITKIDMITDYYYTRNKLLLPILNHLDNIGTLSKIQKEILTSCINHSQCIVNSNSVRTNTRSHTVAREIKKLIDIGLLKSISPRKQTINLDNILIKTSLAYQLEKNGFLPEKLN